jgi:hypothetical protein
MVLDADDPIARAVTAAILSGDLAALDDLLAGHPGLAGAGIVHATDGSVRSFLHIATDWPGHFPRAGATIRRLVEAGADVDARFVGAHTETPLHWAASCDDVEALDALLDCGADIEATGAVIAGGTPLADATAFGQWAAARRLIEWDARSNLFESASLGLLDRVHAHLADHPTPTGDELSGALWGACHGGHLGTAEHLVTAGGDPAWVAPWDATTPTQVAARAGATPRVVWLTGRGRPPATT